MKKLLTILALAALLCLVCSAALATEGLYNLGIITTDEYTALTAADLEGVASITTKQDIPSPMKCEEPVELHIYGKDEGGKNCLVTVYVVQKHHMVKDTTSALNVASTCTSTGVQAWKCDNIGCTYTKTTTIDAKAHNYVANTPIPGEGPTCLTPGYIGTVCTGCGDVKEGTKTLVAADAKYHNFGWTISAPACKQLVVGNELDYVVYPGTIKYSCSTCFTALLNDTTTLTLAQYKSPTATVTVGADTYNVADLLKEKGMTAPAGYDGHDWDAWRLYKDATCLNNAIERRFCTRCTKEGVRTIPDTAKGVVWAIDSTFNPVCTATTATVTCVNCGGAVAGHKNVAVDMFKVDPYRSSVHIEKTGGKTDPQTWDIQLTHNYDKKVKAGTDDATCTTPAYTYYYCTDSNGIRRAGHAVKAVETGAALGHLWGDWKEVYSDEDENAGAGLYKRFCERKDSNGNYVCTASQVYTGSKPANICAEDAHDWEYNADDVKKVTCDGAAHTVRKVCSKCKVASSDTVKYAAHKYEVITVITPATCLEDGLAYAKCTNPHCGWKGEIKLKKEEAGHNTVLIPGKEANCKDAGQKAAYQCTDCKKYFSDEAATEAIEAPEVIPVKADAHVIKEYKQTKAPTCTEEGEEIGVCEVCNQAVTKKIKANGHKWDDGVITTPATYDKKGEKTFTCAICGETKKEEVEFVATETAKYEVKEAVYDGEAVSGKVEHDKNTKELTAAYARVTFFYADGTFAVMVVPVEDGEFYAGATTATVHVAVQIVDNAKQITPPATDAIYGNGSATMK